MAGLERLVCIVCRKRVVNDYMLRDELWRKVARTKIQRRGFMHLACAEMRLGRKITAADLSPGTNQ